MQRSDNITLKAFITKNNKTTIKIGKMKKSIDHTNLDPDLIEDLLTQLKYAKNAQQGNAGIAVPTEYSNVKHVELEPERNSVVNWKNKFLDYVAKHQEESIALPGFTYSSKGAAHALSWSVYCSYDNEFLITENCSTKIMGEMTMFKYLYQKFANDNQNEQLKVLNELRKLINRQAYSKDIAMARNLIAKLLIMAGVEENPGPMKRSLILTLLARACIEKNPGPKTEVVVVEKPPVKKGGVHKRRNNKNKKMSSDVKKLSRQFRTLQATSNLSRQKTKPRRAKMNTRVDASIRSMAEVMPNMNESREILHFLTNPMDCGRLIRWASSFSTAPTAMAAPWTDEDIFRDFHDDSDFFHVAMFRSFECASIVYYNNTSALNAIYKFYISNDTNTGLPATSQTFAIANMNSLDNYPLHLPFAIPDLSTQIKPHSDYWLGGSLDGTQSKKSRFFWLDVGTIIDLQVTGVANMGTTSVLKFYLNQATNETLFDRAVSSTSLNPVGAGTISATVLTAGYYSISLDLTIGDASVTLGTFTFNIKSTCNDPIHGHRPAPKFEANYSTLDQWRIPAMTICITNNSTLVQREGRIVANQLPDRENWFDFMNFATLSSSAGRKHLEATKGVYSYLKPTKPSDFDMKSYLRISSTVPVIADSFYPIFDRGSFLAIGMQIDNPLGRTFIMQICCALEFQTTNTFFNLEQSNYKPASFAEAYEALKNMVQFTENPVHFLQLIRMGAKILNTGATVVSKYGPSVMRGVNRYGPKVISSANRLKKLTDAYS